MELLSLIPMLIKALPVILLGILYALFKREKSKRRRAEEQRDSAKASFELAGETREIEKEGEALVKKVEDADLGGLAGMFHSGLRHDKPKS